ncbi:unnamed protein product [Tuber aestivum]|uniref:Uncharacterized protein n=1 Tax=Tuber aestivum TaxID=59557 RepID=A0A292Q2U8_9PEZI|nr:unnamed protein product [Tuber aestivum]
MTSTSATTFPSTPSCSGEGYRKRLTSPSIHSGRSSLRALTVFDVSVVGGRQAINSILWWGSRERRLGVPRLPSRRGRSVHGGARMGLRGFWEIGGLGFISGYPNIRGGGLVGWRPERGRGLGTTPVLELSFIAMEWDGIGCDVTGGGTVGGCTRVGTKKSEKMFGKILR